MPLGASQAIAATPAANAGQPVAFNLAAIALLAGLCGVALAYGIDAIGTGPAPPPALADSGPAVTQNLAGTDLTIPRSWLRQSAGHDGGFVSQVELQLPVELSAKAREDVTVTLLPRSRGQISATLLDSVYARQFTPETRAGAPGLVGKPLSAADGFEAETVWYDPLSPSPFVAKCADPVTGSDPARCLRTVLLSDRLMAIYVFSAAALPHWRQFDAALAPWLRRIGALQADAR